MRQKCFALGRERQSPRRAMEQLHAEPVFQTNPATGGNVMDCEANAMPNDCTTWAAGL